MLEPAVKRVTFFARGPTVCPVCTGKFYREDLLSGGGRLIAGDLSDELHRHYEASRKFGELYPLAYTIIVCPACLYAAYAPDFPAAQGEAAELLRRGTARRRESVALLFRDLDFSDYRDLEEGAASYLLAVMCYDHFPHGLCPGFKQGLSSLRAAWLLNDLHGKHPGENYDYLGRLFYRKAAFFYREALERAVKGTEALESNLNLGPDLDKNFGYDGFLYIMGLLQYKYGPRKDRDRRLRMLEEARRAVSKLFGTGKASRDKPSALLEKSKAVYEQIGQEIRILKGEG